MQICTQCKKRLLRARRRPWEKIFYDHVYTCSGCKRRVGALHSGIITNFRFVFSRYSHCIRCGSSAVQRLAKRDMVDGFSHNPLACVQVLLGAPVNRCSPCRLQFYDWRDPQPGVEAWSDSWTEP